MMPVVGPKRVALAPVEVLKVSLAASETGSAPPVEVDRVTLPSTPELNWMVLPGSMAPLVKEAPELKVVVVPSGAMILPAPVKVTLSLVGTPLGSVSAPALEVKVRAALVALRSTVLPASD